MPSNKILSVLILCLGIILSVWLFIGEPEKKDISAGTENNGEVVPAIQVTEKTNEDWKKILTSVEKKNKIEDLTLNSYEEFDGTMTDQLSRDFLSQYFLAIQNGNEITPEKAFGIAQTSLSLPEYNRKPTVYIRQNLKITNKSDPETMKKYKEKINQSLQSLYYRLENDPMVLVTNAIATQTDTDLKKLDPIIAINKSAIKYLLEMEVPEKAVALHLELLNGSSSILLDLEGMRVGLDDPVRLFGVISNYSEDSGVFANILIKMDEFLRKNS